MDISPREFEFLVAETFQRQLSPIPIEVLSPEVFPTTEGDYEIDVTIRFSLLEMDFLVLVECKRHSSPIKRETVQLLRDKLTELGAQKGVLFSTSEFQSGAIAYAAKHGVGLVLIRDGASSWVAKAVPKTKYPDHLPRFIAWHVTPHEDQDGADYQNLKHFDENFARLIKIVHPL